MTTSQERQGTGRPVAVAPVRRRAARGRGALAAVLAAAALAGLGTALLAPLGPTTAPEGLAVVVTGLLIGLAGGRVTGAARVAVPLVVVHAAAVELGRWGLDLPTVDGIRLDSAYGVLALLAGRGVHGLLLVPPLVLGTLVGAGLARRAAGPAPRHRVGTAVAGALVAALLVALAWPATTPPVLDAAGAPVPGSIATLETVTLGGDEHTLLLRADDPEAPVLLYLSGGPGQSDLALARVLAEPWTDDVVFATYDQRGNGSSYGALVPADEVTLDRVVDDTIELAELLRDRFAEDKIVLMGESWGTILGVLAVQRRPDLFHAWIGSGQMVDVRETDRRIYRDLQAVAARTGDTGLAETLRDIGEPPYRDLPWANAAVMGAYGRLYEPYTPSEGYLARGRESGLDPFGLLGQEYAPITKPAVLRGLIDTFTVVYPQIQDLDLRRDVPRLDVPVFVLDGAAEMDARRDLALEWFARLEAPRKELVTFEGAAHAVAFEQADAVERLLVREVLPPRGAR